MGSIQKGSLQDKLADIEIRSSAFTFWLMISIWSGFKSASSFMDDDFVHGWIWAACCIAAWARGGHHEKHGNKTNDAVLGQFKDLKAENDKMRKQLNQNSK